MAETLSVPAIDIDVVVASSDDDSIDDVTGAAADVDAASPALAFAPLVEFDAMEFMTLI